LSKKEGNLAVKDLSDVLTDKIVDKRDFVNTRNLTTVCAIVPRS